MQVHHSEAEYAGLGLHGVMHARTTAPFVFRISSVLLHALCVFVPVSFRCRLVTLLPALYNAHSDFFELWTKAVDESWFATAASASMA